MKLVHLSGSTYFKDVRTALVSLEKMVSLQQSINSKP